MSDSLPTVEEIMMLPAQVKRVVPAEFIDANGHMNVVHYLSLGIHAADVVVRDVGITDDYRAERRRGVFTAEHHLNYYSELHLGDEISAHTRVLGRSDKAVHMMVFIVDVTDGRLANTLELTLVHVGMDTRRPADLPEDVAAGFDRFIEEHAALAWDAPLSGAMGIRDQGNEDSA